MKWQYKITGVTTYFLLPFFALAAPATFKDFVTLLVDIINVSIIPLIFAITLVAFLWGVFQYMFFPDSEEKKQKGKQVIVWGIIALAIMVSVWGLVNIVYNTFFWVPAPTTEPLFLNI